MRDASVRTPSRREYEVCRGATFVHAGGDTFRKACSSGVGEAREMDGFSRREREVVDGEVGEDGMNEGLPAKRTPTL